MIPGSKGHKSDASLLAERIFEEKRINGEGMVIIGLSPKRKY